MFEWIRRPVIHGDDTIYGAGTLSCSFDSVFSQEEEQVPKSSRLPGGCVLPPRLIQHLHIHLHRFTELGKPGGGEEDLYSLTRRYRDPPTFGRHLSDRLLPSSNTNLKTITISLTLGDIDVQSEYPNDCEPEVKWGQTLSPKVWGTRRGLYRPFAYRPFVGEYLAKQKNCAVCDDWQDSNPADLKITNALWANGKKAGAVLGGAIDPQDIFMLWVIDVDTDVSWLDGCGRWVVNAPSLDGQAAASINREQEFLEFFMGGNQEVWTLHTLMGATFSA